MSKNSKYRIIPFFLPYRGCKKRCLYCWQGEGESGQPLAISQKLLAAIFKALVVCPDNLATAELAFYGGTFSALAKKEQELYLKTLQPLLKTKIIRGIRISTRPDEIDSNLLTKYKEYGVTTIELGLQSLDNKVLQASARGYTAEIAEEACRLVKGADLQLGIHLMLGLPAESKNSFLQTVKRVVQLKPQFVRIHPTLVIAGTKLASLWQEGKYQALDKEMAKDWLSEGLEVVKNNKINLARLGIYLSPQLKKRVLAGAIEYSLGNLR